jgi:hypothetical protein
LRCWRYRALGVGTKPTGGGRRVGVDESMGASSLIHYENGRALPDGSIDAHQLIIL